MGKHWEEEESPANAREGVSEGGTGRGAGPGPRTVLWHEGDVDGVRCGGADACEEGGALAVADQHRWDGKRQRKGFAVRGKVRH